MEIRERQGGNKYLTADEKEERGENRVHSFWRKGKSFIFDVRIMDSDTAR